MRNLVYHLAVGASIMLSIAGIQAQTPADQPRNEIEVRGVYSVPSGESSFSDNGSAGSTISFSRDFDFQNELGFELRYSYKSTTGKHKFLAQYSHTSWNRTTTLSRSFTFLGQTYLANLNASGDLKLTTFRGMYSYRWGNEKIRFGPMVDMGVVNTRLNISGTTNNGTRSGEGTITKFAATVGYDLDFEPTAKVNIFNNLGAIVFSGQHLFHVEGGLKFFPARHFGVSGGYKFERYKLEDNQNFITVRMHGPFFGGVLRF